MAINIDEAIKILERYSGTDFLKYESEFLASAKLGIEALKALREYRKYGYSSKYPILPGETTP